MTARSKYRYINKNTSKFIYKNFLMNVSQNNELGFANTPMPQQQNIYQKKMFSEIPSKIFYWQGHFLVVFCLKKESFHRNALSFLLLSGYI